MTILLETDRVCLQISNFDAVNGSAMGFCTARFVFNTCERLQIDVRDRTHERTTSNTFVA